MKPTATEALILAALATTATAKHHHHRPHPNLQQRQESPKIATADPLESGQNYTPIIATVLVTETVHLTGSAPVPPSSAVTSEGIIAYCYTSPTISASGATSGIPIVVSPSESPVSTSWVPCPCHSSEGGDSGQPSSQGQGSTGPAPTGSADGSQPTNSAPTESMTGTVTTAVATQGVGQSDASSNTDGASKGTESGSTTTATSTSTVSKTSGTAIATAAATILDVGTGFLGLAVVGLILL